MTRQPDRSREPGTSDSDAELIRRSLTDSELFAALFDRHAPALYRFAARRLGRDVAMDVVADTFLKAFERRHRYDLSRDDAGPWLFGIVAKLISRHRQTEQRRFDALVRDAGRASIDEVSTDRVADEIVARGSRADLVSALARMPRRNRDVLLLAAWADQTYDEISAALGIPIGTVRSRLHRAREALRAVLGHDPRSVSRGT